VSDAVRVAKEILRLSAWKGKTVLLESLVRTEPVSSSDSGIWNQGYQLAEEVLQALSLPKQADNIVSIHSVLQRLSIRWHETTFEDSTIRAIAAASPKHHPAVLINKNSEMNRHNHGQRFTLAHELCHILFDRSRGQKLTIASGPWAPPDIEKRANAFAAMFLMPPDLIKKAINELGISIDDIPAVVRVANKLRTGFAATLHHLANLGFINSAARNRMEVELEEQAVTYEGNSA